MKTSLAIAALLLTAAVTPGAAAAEEIPVPTTATIHKGVLFDELPGQPSPGTTDLSMPFFGRISAADPACQIRRSYELGRIENGDFISIGGTTVGADGKWVFGLAGEPPSPFAVAVRVPPRKTVSNGVAYLCEETVSSTVPFDARDFTPCLLAQAAQRGYAPAIRKAKRDLRSAKANGQSEAVAYIRQKLKGFRAQHDSIVRAVKERC